MAGPVDINTADAATIARELNGIGDSRARAIVEFREKNGRFASPEDVLKVSGIGPQVGTTSARASLQRPPPSPDLHRTAGFRSRRPVNQSSPDLPRIGYHPPSNNKNLRGPLDVATRPNRRISRRGSWHALPAGNQGDAEGNASHCR
jgi:competence ComEA-like helix-hairpin-helix protein